MGKAADFAKERQAETRGAPMMQINPVFPREMAPVANSPQAIEETRDAYADYATMTIDDILLAVKEGRMNGMEVVALEQTGKQRKGILEALGLSPVTTQVEITPETPGT